MYGLKEPRKPIFVGGSGTTLRLILGVLAAQNFKATLTAGRSLSTRPMFRVIHPLRLMGAQIKARLQEREDGEWEEYAPIVIKGGNLNPIAYEMPVASAQVKSAILLAGLYSNGTTQVVEREKTRDHTERMLKLFGADIKVKQNKIVIKKKHRGLSSPKRIYIPADISSASFFIILATIIPGSYILIRKVSLNPLRIGIIRVLKRMGADIEVQRLGQVNQHYEPMGDLRVRSSLLKATRVKREEIPSLIDELPILMVASCFAKGRTVFEAVKELRVKETDRIRSMSENLRKMGGNIKIVKTRDSENIVIEGVKCLVGKRVRSFGDHRTAMSMVIAGLKAKGRTVIDEVACINKSFPGFSSLLKSLMS